MMCKIDRVKQRIEYENNFILHHYRSTDQAINAEVRSDDVMYSSQDVIVLMNMAVENFRKVFGDSEETKHLLKK